MHSVPEIRRSASALAVVFAFGFAAAPAAAGVRAEVAFHRGVAAYGEGRLFEAEREFQVVLEENPEDTAALSYLGLIAGSQGEVDAAVSYFERALTIDPDDAEIRLQLAIVLLEARRNVEADVQLSTVRSRLPGDAYALYYSGVAAYRAGRYAEAVRYFKSALGIEPELRLQARYYVGLCEVFLRDSEGAMGDFAAVEQQSPTHPLSRSAAQLLAAMQGPDPNLVTAQATVGVEYDSNPLGVGDVDLVSGDDDGDVRGVFLVSAQLRPLNEPLGLVLGYDGFLSVHAEQDKADQQTHLVWAGISAPLGPVRLGLRGDVSWSAIDLSETFRWLYRTLPTISIPVGDLGLAQLYYEFEYNDFRTVNDSNVNTALAANPVLKDALDLDGPRHTVGARQFIFFKELLLKELQAGAAYTKYDAQGSEFEYSGFEVSAGGTLDLGLLGLRRVGLGAAEFSALYRYQYRDFDNRSQIEVTKQREDHAHRILVDLRMPLTTWLDASVFGRFSINDSNIDVFNFDRQVGGVNLTAHY